MSAILTNIRENINVLIEEAKANYEKRKAMTKYAREIETELAYEEITVRSVTPFAFSYAFGESREKHDVHIKPQRKSKPTGNSKSSKDIILEFLKEKPDYTATSAELNSYFIKIGRSTPAPTLSLMVKAKLIENISRGYYKLIINITE